MQQSRLGKRVEAIDTLRGIAIFGMVLSGSIAFGDILPAWMYHAQVPPPLHQFNPALPGITWVDLVFPLFLFCMGAALSFSVAGKLASGKTKSQISFEACKRYLQLLFFALFFQHCKAWVIHENPLVEDQLISIMGFLLIGGQLVDLKGRVSTQWQKIIKYSSYLLGVTLLYILPFKDGRGFDFYRSDIIIVVLANMAFFAAIIYLLTLNRPVVRGLVLLVVAAIILSSREASDNVVKQFFNFKAIAGISFDWAYKFYFLKYLMIVLPGTWAGDLLFHYQPPMERKPVSVRLLEVLLPFVLLITLLALLFIRTSEGYNFLILFLLGVLSWFRFRKSADQAIQKSIAYAGLYMLLLGLLLEPYEGGIKKDPSTFSYYFVTSGFSFWGLLLLLDLESSNWIGFLRKFLGALGRNPLVAYATGSLLILPLLSLLSLKDSWDSWAHTPWQGFLKGIIFTLLVSGLTLLLNRLRLFWRA